MTAFGESPQVLPEVGDGGRLTNGVLNQRGVGTVSR